MPTSKRLYDFQCSPPEGACGVIFEELVYEFEPTCLCPNCGKQATKMLSAPNIWWRKMGVDTDFPTSAAKWERMQRCKNRTDKGGRADGQPNLKEY